MQIGDLLVFAMEYIEGEDLAAMVKAHGPLPVANACYYIQQAAMGLQHAFERGMVHRDIKPQNLILSRSGKKHIAKILDFGLAKARVEKGVEGGLTAQGMMLGTPDFIAPEQTVDAASADIRADIYSLGCTLYFLLTGSAPFTGKSLYKILQAHHSVEAKPLNLARAEVSPALAAVVAKMMAKDPGQHYQKPIEVVQALTPFIKPETKSLPAAASPPPLPSPAATFTPKAPASLTMGNSVDVILQPMDTRNPSTAQTRQPGGVWADLTDLGPKTVEPPKNKPPRPRRPSNTPSASSNRNWWLIGSCVGTGLLALLLIALWAGGVFKLKVKEGWIVLENLPAEAEVLVDGERITLSKLGEKEPIEIRVAPERAD